ncbi:hypothetical protein RI103_33345 [Paraburkholderia sp. FT54]|uniref:hypothetical protein n=1 Tax=Paraburkholderia sp. FT54 TaxID=3074437 RepID=UPI0028775177|nr:hypothetical protein [Paraburkholderia sp. FT54]WNC94822.1 hypothetical protein RI103_33345 [Paraburkholderia sp. FT54]
MANSTRWTSVLSHCIAGSSRKTASRVSCQRFLRAWLGVLCALLLTGEVAQAATIHGGDILVVDARASKLFLVDPKTGARTVISDFLDPSQGPVDRSLLAGVAIGRGKIYVTAATTGIYAVDPRTGNRTLVSDFTTGAFRGDVFGSTVDASGRLMTNWAQPQFGGAPRSIVRIDTRTGTRVVVSDLTNPAQGDVFNCCVAYFTDLALEKTGAIVASVTWFIPVGPSRDVGDMYRVDPLRGQRSLLSDFTNPAQGATGLVPSTGIAIETSGQILVNSHGSAIAPVPKNLLLRIDPNTGNRTVLSDFDNAAQGPLGWRLSGIALAQAGTGGIIVGAGDPANRAADPTLLFRIDPQTGQRTLLSNSSDPKQGPPFVWIFEIAVVPENAINAGFVATPPTDSFASPFGPVK